MTHLLQLPAPVVSAGAGLHADQTAGLTLEERKKLAAPELATHDWPAAVVDRVNLKDVLGEVDTDCASFEHGWLPRLGR